MRKRKPLKIIEYKFLLIKKIKVSVGVGLLPLRIPVLIKEDFLWDTSQ
jgi:hypothetical protein